jgi:hypothetical protein
MKRVRKKSHVPVKVGGLAPTVETLSDLSRDLYAIAETHPELYWKVYQLIGWLLLPDGFIWQQPENRDWMRHLTGRHHLEKGKKWDEGGGSDLHDDEEGAFQSAANELRNHPAGVGPDRIKKIYKRGERKLPPELRRVKPRLRGRPRTG